MIGLFPWLARLLFGSSPEEHECQEFTRWTACVIQVQTVATAAGKPLAEEDRYEVSRYFQERRCTLCGKVFQEPLEFDSLFDDDGNDEE